MTNMISTDAISELRTAFLGKHSKQELIDVNPEMFIYPDAAYGFTENTNDPLANDTITAYMADAVAPVGSVYNMQFVNGWQYYEYRKALFFGDNGTMHAIQYADTTHEDKDAFRELGRQVIGYDENKWKRIRESVMFDQLMYRFMDDENMRRTLQWTDESYIIYNDDMDTLWGTGVPMMNDNKPSTNWLHVDNWTGENRLGFILMDIRDAFEYLDYEID